MGQIESMDPRGNGNEREHDQTRDNELTAGLNDVGAARSCDFPLPADLADATSFNEKRGPRRR